MNHLRNTAVALYAGLGRHFQSSGSASLFVGLSCNLALVGEVYFFPALWHTSALRVSYTDVAYVAELLCAVALLVHVRRGGAGPSPRMLWIAAALVQTTLVAYSILFEMGLSAPLAMDWICGAVFGLYVPLSMLSWLQAHDRLSASAIVWNIMLSAVFGSFVIWVLMGLEITRNCVCSAVLLFVATWILTQRMRVHGREERSSLAGKEPADREDPAFRYPPLAVFLFSFAFAIAISFAGTKGDSAVFSAGTFFAPLVAVCALVLLLNFSSFPFTNIAVSAIVTAVIAASSLNVDPAVSFDLAALGLFLFLAYAVVSLRGDRRAASLALLRLVIAFACGCIAGRVAMALCSGSADSTPDALVLLSILSANAAMIVLIRRGATPRRLWELLNGEEATEAVEEGLSAAERVSIDRIAVERNLGVREKEVLMLLLEGRSASEVAATLVIANGTAKSHIRHVYKKLGVHSRAELFDLVGVEREEAGRPAPVENRNR